MSPLATNQIELPAYMMDNDSECCDKDLAKTTNPFCFASEFEFQHAVESIAKDKQGKGRKKNKMKRAISAASSSSSIKPQIGRVSSTTSISSEIKRISSTTSISSGNNSSRIQRISSTTSASSNIKRVSSATSIVSVESHLLGSKLLETTFMTSTDGTVHKV
eukprot:Awhi_evm1s13929